MNSWILPQQALAVLSLFFGYSFFFWYIRSKVWIIAGTRPATPADVGKAVVEAKMRYVSYLILSSKLFSFLFVFVFCHRRPPVLNFLDVLLESTVDR